MRARAPSVLFAKVPCLGPGTTVPIGLRGQHRPLQVDAAPTEISEVLGEEKLSGQAVEHKDEVVHVDAPNASPDSYGAR